MNQRVPDLRAVDGLRRSDTSRTLPSDQDLREWATSRGLHVPHHPSAMTGLRDLYRVWSAHFASSGHRTTGPSSSSTEGPASRSTAA